MQTFIAELAPGPDETILDVGGTPLNWALVDYDGPVVLLNIESAELLGELPDNVTYVHGDATQLPFGTGAFPIAFSNSVIEHLHSFETQERFAAEVRRVAGRLWVQTPARWFPIEPHFLMPLIHFLPKRVQRRLVRNFTLFGWIARPTQQTAEALVDEYRLLTYREMKRLFPDCEIRRERFIGLTKSYIALRRASPPPSKA